MKRYIEVVEFETENVVHCVDVTDKSERYADRVMDGMDRNLNHDKFYTRCRVCVADHEKAKP